MSCCVVLGVFSSPFCLGREEGSDCFVDVLWLLVFYCPSSLHRALVYSVLGTAHYLGVIGEVHVTSRGWFANNLGFPAGGLI